MGLRSTVFRRLAIFWLALTSILALNCAQAQMTPAAVEQFLTDLELATERRDVPTVIGALADDVIIVFRFSAMGEVPDMRFNKTQYRDFLATALSAIEAHSARRFGTKISISDDGRTAEVFANVEETTTVQGKTSVHVSRQTVLIVYEDGQMQVKRVFAEVVQEANET